MPILKNLRKLCSLRGINCNLTPLAQRLCSNNTATGTEEYLGYDKDPQPLFTDAETQKLLQSMTQLQLEKIFRKRTVPDNGVDYKFMTTEQLEDEYVRTVEKARKLLKMPPVVQIKEDKQQIISEDSALKDFSDTKYVITDITYGLRQSERKVVVRQTDGTLQYAPLEMAKRVNQLYFPLSGRKIAVPRMFEDEHLKRCLEEHKYEFVLNRLLVQYEPYELDYHRISSRVYQHINESKQFDQLRSTRHFGPMTFFYAWHRCIDDLLYDMIRRDYLVNGAELIALLYKLHSMQNNYQQLLEQLDSFKTCIDPALAELRKQIVTPKRNIHDEIEMAIGKTAADFAADELCLQFIEHYIKTHALKKVQLELAVQTLKEINVEKKQLFEGLNKAHGSQ